MRQLLPYHALFVVALLLICSCGASSDHENQRPSLRPGLKTILASTQAAADTYDLEDIMDDLGKYSRDEMSRLTEDDWRANLESIAALPAEIMVVADSVVARWHQVGVVHDGINHRDDLARFERRRDETPSEALDLFADFMGEEIESADPDLKLLNRLAHLCQPYYDQLSPDEQASWRNEFDHSPAELASIFSDRPTFEHFMENW